jgi:hypothetical protein
MDLIDVFPAPDFPMSRTFFFDILPRVDWNCDLTNLMIALTNCLLGTRDYCSFQKSHYNRFSCVTLGSVQKVKSNCELSGTNESFKFVRVTKSAILIAFV